MGQFHFYIPEKYALSPEALQSVWVSYWEGPLHIRKLTGPSTLTIRCEEPTPGYVHIAWPVEGFGSPMLMTPTLIQRDRPYLLPVELARGLIYRIRRALALWGGTGGAVPPAELEEEVQALSARFVQTISSQAEQDDQVEKAQELLRDAFAISERLVIRKAQQGFDRLVEENGRLHGLLGLRVDQAPSEEQSAEIGRSFNAVALSTASFDLPTVEPQNEEDEEPVDIGASLDRLVDWSGRFGTSVCMGPLLFGRHYRGNPIPRIASLVRRYRGRVGMWYLAVLGAPDEPALPGLPHRLGAVLSSLETVRRLDAKTPIVIGFSRPLDPWRAEVNEPALALHLAIGLIRAQIGIDGLALHLDWGYQPHGTPYRDLLQFGEQIDIWGELHLPLVVFLRSPTSTDPSEGVPHPPAETVEQILTLLASRPFIRAVYWDTFQDESREGEYFPNSGLFDAQGTAGPVVGVFEQLRERYFE